MLKIHIGDMPGVIHATPIYFNNKFKPEWLEDELVKNMIKDIDKSDVLSPYCIQSPVLGQIPPKQLSGGVKTLILILKMPDKVFNATQCGDNCAKWLLHIAKEKDITVRMGHTMNFGKQEFEIEIANTGERVDNMSDYVDISHSILFNTTDLI